MPLIAVVPGMPLVIWLLFKACRQFEFSSAHNFAELIVLMVLIGYALAVWPFGLGLPTIALVFWMLIVKMKMRLWRALIYAAVIFPSTH